MTNNFVLQFALITLVILLIPCMYRIWKGPEMQDRLLAVDLLTTILTGMIVLEGVIEGVPLYIDIGIALAAFSFIGTLGLARYIAEGKVF
jgi:multicomponent Na+:H+ antiporter subunit F